MKARVGFQLVFLFVLVSSALVPACMPTKRTTGAFTEVTRLESDLQRRISTKAEVERLLGAPKGPGGALLPAYPKPSDVWFYQDFEIDDIKSEGAVYRYNVRQQILFVFFDKDVFDGFFWYSHNVPGTVKVSFSPRGSSGETLRYGSPPPIDHLDALKRGVSGKGDALLALGQPRGEGMLHYVGPENRPENPWTIWFYEYTKLEGKVVDLKILLVFFDRDKYDGYLWGSSIQEGSTGK